MCGFCLKNNGEWYMNGQGYVFRQPIRRVGVLYKEAVMAITKRIIFITSITLIGQLSVFLLKTMSFLH
jgi:hypothetical protein